MHNAPSVTYPVGRSRLAGGFLAVAWLAGAAGIAAWCLQVHPSAPRMAAGLGTVIVAGAFALRGWTRSPWGVLAWNGEGWTWKGEGVAEPGEPECVLDLQHTMLLRWDARGRSRWLCAEHGSDPLRWDDLRRAVYSRARSGEARGASPESEAKP